MNKIMKLSKFFTEDCVIIMTSGEKIKGSKDVASFVLGACEAYNDGYMRALVKGTFRGVAIGAIIAGSGIAISEIIRSVNENKSKVIKKEA